MQTEIDFTQFPQGAVRADFGGADGAFEDAGNLGEREFLKAREQQHLAVVAIEAGEGGAEQRVVVARRRMVRGVRCVVGVFLQIRGVGGVGRGVALAEMIRSTTAREVIHPGGEAAVVAVGVPVFQHTLKYRLRDILGRLALAGVFHEKPEERAVMTLEEFAQRIEFAAAHGEHQGMVGALFDRRVHGGRNAGAVNQSGTRRDMNFVEGGDHGGSGTWLSDAGRTGRRANGYMECDSTAIPLVGRQCDFGSVTPNLRIYSCGGGRGRNRVQADA